MIGFQGYSEGDYVRTVEGLFFAVKGGRHPDGLIVAYLRYIPDEGGDRVLDGVRYRRVSDPGETTEYLRLHHPRYLNHVPRLGLTLQTVPLERVERAYDARERLQQVLLGHGHGLEATVRRLVEALSRGSGVPASSFGVSGSLLIGLHREGSDVDLNVYGVEEGRSVYEALRLLRGEGAWVQPYDAETVRVVLQERWGGAGVNLEAMAGLEARKVLHGRVEGRDYFMRLLRPEPDSAPSAPVGEAVFRARVTDSTYSIFTPCSYKLGEIEPLEPRGLGRVGEAVSYRGKFTEQAAAGDLVEIRGTLERVGGPRGRLRVVLGGGHDYMLPPGLR
jgi:predicted nucleotidyltransferase